jgi:PAS domain S-box-containing protein
LKAPRHIAAVALILGLTVAGFVVAGVLAERDAQRESERRVAIASAQIRSRMEVATSLTAGLSRFMSDAGAGGVTDDRFRTIALRWLSPAGLPAAAWAQEVRAGDRDAYERGIGRPIVAPDERRKAVPPASSYLSATLVSGVSPLNSRGIDLRREPGIAAALDRAIRPGGVGATPVAARSDGTRGLFLVAPAPSVIGGVLRPGVAVVFLSEATLRAAARNPTGLRFPPADRSAAGRDAVRDEFAVAGQQIAVVMPKQSVGGPGAVLPWIILAGGLVLAALAGALGVNAARRARAQQDFDRIFNLSPDLVGVADFDGRFTRVNPAAELVLGYPEEELLARPYLEFVHPDDRERTAAESAAVAQGKTTLSFENRVLRKDGSLRVLEWTVTPVVEDAAMYGMARDVTERRRAETESERLAAEQSALRRVAELVARHAPPVRVFAAVSEELSHLLGVSTVRTVRFEPDGSATVLGALSEPEAPEPPGTNIAPPRGGVLDQVVRTGRAARVDDYAHVPDASEATLRQIGVRSAAGGPIVVDGSLWGAMLVASDTANALPAGTEDRVAQFAELVSTAISNIESRAKVEQLAAEQSALRRVATLVASEHSPDDLFATLVEEVRVLLGVDASEILRYEADATATMVAGWTDSGVRLPVGERLPLDGDNLAGEVQRSGLSRRKEDYGDALGAIADMSREVGIRCAVASPIVVEGAIWGMIAVATRRSEPLPPDTEARLAEFSRVAGMAVANAKSRSDLAQSRARIVRAGDEARRRFERDLHDGAQQRLVSLGLELRAAEATVPRDLGDVRRVVSRVGTGLNDVLDDLRELSRGLHPAVLSEDGLTPALQSLALRSAVPVDLRVDLDGERFEEPVEVAAYYVASEALTNTAKHAHASGAEVTARRRDGWLELTVSDDGRGGADASSGSGLTGLVDRVEAIGGTIQIVSPQGAGTTVRVKLPTGGSDQRGRLIAGRGP